MDALLGTLQVAPDGTVSEIRTGHVVPLFAALPDGKYKFGGLTLVPADPSSKAGRRLAKKLIADGKLLRSGKTHCCQPG